MRRAPPARAPRRLAVAAGALGGALLGGWLGLARGGAFVPPVPLDPARWNVLTPGRDAAVVDQRGRGTGVVGDVLELVPHVFSRADVVAQRDPRPLAEVRVELAPDSGPLSLRLHEDGRLVHLLVAPGAVRVPPGDWRPHEGPVVVRVADGAARVGEVSLGPARAPGVELSAAAEPVRVRRLTLVDADGAAFLDEDPAATWPSRAPVLPGAVLGAVAGAAAAAVGLPGVLAAALPLLVCFAPTGAWLGLVERLYLVRATPWELARLLLAASLLPLLVLALAATARVMPGPGGDRRAFVPWLLAALPAAALASRDLAGAGWLLLPVGVAFLLAPLAFARAARVDPLGLLLRDLPAHVAVAALGFGVGLLPALAWRLVVLAAGAGALLRRAPRAAADALFLSALAVLPAAELAARSCWLDLAWDAARLDGEASWRDPRPFWEGACGAGDRDAVLFAGGSSTGGAYQFAGDPTAFFPAQVHARLCASGRALRTLNNGDGGRDSFTVSRSIDALLAAHHPRLVVLYVGVNDLLTSEHTLTRAQREALEAERSTAARGLDALARRSRLLTGLGLLGRPAVDLDAPVVPDVPLPDAEVNLRRVAAATRAAGARLLLLPEYTTPDRAAEMATYGALQARLAEELPGVHHVDVRAALAPYAGEGLLLDRNHLSRQGSGRLADVLAPVVASLLAGEASDAPDAPRGAAAR